MWEINHLKVKTEKANLSNEEFSALRNLRNNKNAVIKKADKGSAVVIMDRNQYLHEAYKQLNNPANYSKLDHPIYPETANEIKNILLDIFMALLGNRL